MTHPEPIPTLLAQLREAMLRNDVTVTQRLLDTLDHLLPADELAALLERLLDDEPLGPALMA